MLEMVTGAGSAGDGHWSLERAVLEMVTGAGSAGDGHWSGQCWRWSLVTGADNAGDCHWSGQCWRWSLVTGAGSAVDGHWSLERAVLEEMVTGHWSDAAVTFLSDCPILLNWCALSLLCPTFSLRMMTWLFHFTL